MNEQEYGARIGGLLERYAADAPVPATEPLVAGGLARGRRSRARRRTLLATGGLAVVAAVTAGTVLTGGGGGGGAAGGSLARAGTAALPRFAPVASVREAAAPSGDEVVARLRKLLPDGGRTGGWEQDKDAGGRLLVGGGEVTVNLQRDFAYSDVRARTKDVERELARKAREPGPADKGWGPRLSKEEARARARKTEAAKKLVAPDKAALTRLYSCARLRTRAEGVTSCAAENLKDGTLLLRYETRRGALVVRTADALRPDASRVVVTAANARDTEHGPATLSAPPLSLDRVAEIAGDTGWRG
ncbi:hypothetical protein ACQYWQ_10870 [Streptomyces sp. P6-2-1]|uniref:hypothetical protein n=1 Tax=Streptomyces sp. P6-2-1 TaxID=3422591 RepID=UPI003D35B162